MVSRSHVHARAQRPLLVRPPAEDKTAANRPCVVVVIVTVTVRFRFRLRFRFSEEMAVFCF